MEYNLIEHIFLFTSYCTVLWRWKNIDRWLVCIKQIMDKKRKFYFIQRLCQSSLGDRQKDRRELWGNSLWVICRPLTDWGIQYRWHLNYSATGGATIIAYSPVLPISKGYFSYSHFSSFGTFCCLFGRRLKNFSNAFFKTVAWFFKILYSKLLHLQYLCLHLCQRIQESVREFLNNLWGLKSSRNRVVVLVRQAS